MYVVYIPFAPFNYDNLETSNNELLYVKKIYEDVTENITLYKNSAEPNRVDKSTFLELVGTFYGVFRDDTSIINMSLTIEYPSVVDFNYIYIPIFNRYYFVTDITLIRYNLYNISLSCDVLMSYKNAILNCKGFIDRNEFTYDDKIIDTKRVIEQGVDIEDISIQNNVFENDTCYVLNGFAIRNYE